MRVDFVTLSRSDYASMRPVALAAEKDDGFDLRVIAGGSHLLKRFGEEIHDIARDGYKNIETVSFLNEDDDTDEEMAAASARALAEMVRVFTKERPDRVFIIGDRWEMIPVVLAASMLRIPVIHHSGGDITQGSADNQTRYVLTTLSHLHLVALDDHARRLERMGEEVWRIFVTGEPALSSLKDHTASVPDIQALLGLSSNSPFSLATFHPVSYEGIAVEVQLEIFLQSLDSIKGDIVLTAPNPDAGAGLFYQKMLEFSRNHKNIHFFENLGSAKYYAAMASAEFMIGNSSSGLWEAPSFGLPVVNMGERQKGRVRGKNVIDAPMKIEEIKKAIEKARNPDFKKSLLDRANPYVRDNTVSSILAAIKKDVSNDKLLAKVFVDPLEIQS
jgi:UDP-hydrolysing UDP-N-acetyl-D-glucosamine 2-epimerase